MSRWRKTQHGAGWGALAKCVIETAIKDNDMEFFNSRIYELFSSYCDIENIKPHIEESKLRNLYETHTAMEIRTITGKPINSIYFYASARKWKIGSRREKKTK